MTKEMKQPKSGVRGRGVYCSRLYKKDTNVVMTMKMEQPRAESENGEWVVHVTNLRFKEENK